MSQQLLFRKTRWQKDRVESLKTQVRNELAQISSASERMSFLGSKMETLASKSDAQSECLRYVYVMSSLVQHERHGGLKANQIKRAYNLALALLANNGVAPGDGKLAYLHGELHLIMSHIHRSSGDAWMSAFENRLIQVYSRKSPPGGFAFHALSAGTRALRLGDARTAIAEYEAATMGELTDGLAEKAKLGHIKALRLAKQWGEALNLMQSTRNESTLSEAGAKEVAWEATCIEAADEMSPAPLVALVRKRRAHFESIYLLEAHLWVFAFGATQWRDHLAKVRTLARREDLKPQNHGIFYKYVLKLEELSEGERLPTEMVQDFGRLLGKIGELNTVDKELLVWLASAQVFRSRKVLPLAHLCYSKYEALSLQLTQGLTGDALGVLADQNPFRQETNLYKSAG